LGEAHFHRLHSSALKIGNVFELEFVDPAGVRLAAQKPGSMVLYDILRSLVKDLGKVSTLEWTCRV
jgi:hypothetical protein